MLKYKDYKLVDPTYKVSLQIQDLINDQNGSVFHEPKLNQIIEKKFDTEFCYLVNHPKNIKHASVVHITKNKFGFRRYNLSPLADIPYSGFIGNIPIDFPAFSIGINESLNYVGFPYEREGIIEPSIWIGKTTMVDLSLNEDDIFSKIIHSKRRNMIRKALKSGIHIETYNNAEGFEVFWPILEKLHNKLFFKNLDYNYYKKIIKTYFIDNKSFIKVAFKNEKPISGVLIMGNKNYMHYYKGASSFDSKNEGQGELLQWESIKHSKKLGVRYYDLCNLNKEKLPDIYRFKTGISKDIFQYPVYHKNTTLYRISNKLCNYK